MLWKTDIFAAANIKAAPWKDLHNEAKESHREIRGSLLLSQSG
jgi:hypothetical protein